MKRDMKMYEKKYYTTQKRDVSLYEKRLTDI